MQFQFEFQRTVLSVSQITETLKHLIQQQPNLQNVWVQGQLSNYVRAGSGHIYFTLKDAKSQIPCVLFQNYASRLRFAPHDGDEVLVQGQVNVYPPQGKYQINVTAVEPRGIGALQRAFEALKQKLADEGIFDDKHKKPLPKFPQRIGVITSASGAAIQDIRHQLEKRYPLAELWLHPTLVQGEHAPAQIAEAVQSMNFSAQRSEPPIDVLIVARGGGSLEDLWAFNEERVARAIFDSAIPVVSAVGHETDYTIADMVADHRAPTPSAAIEHLVPDRLELLVDLGSREQRLHRITEWKRQALKAQLVELERRLSPIRQKDKINELSQTVDNLESTCKTAVARSLDEHQRALANLEERLHALSPLATLKRGYSISRKENGGILTRVEQVDVGELIEIELSQGILLCSVQQRFFGADFRLQEPNTD